ncbi:M3 family oligoendopeptidase [bacterium]|nr:M3 family oligoendopeptidase [bacterium]
MSTSVQDPPSLPSWDLSELYHAVDDPRIDQDLTSALEKAQRFESIYRGKISQPGISSQELLLALDAYEGLLRNQSRPGCYASLHYSTDTTDTARGALTQKVREIGSKISTHLIFFDLELAKLPLESFDRLLSDNCLDKYRHYLEQQQALAKHYLSEAEETVLEETANCRGRAFKRLFTEVTSRMKFKFEKEGQTTELTQSELLAYSYDADRSLRQQASQSLAAELQNNAHVLTFIHNTLLHEKQISDRLRGFEHPESDRHLSNELDKAVIDTMTEVCVKNFDIVHEYYDLKRRLLGLDSLAHYDRYAPLRPQKQQIDYNEARQLVISAFQRFSPKMGDMVKPFFEKDWIDVPPKPGKRSGAFCAAVTPDHHPYVLLNYTGKARDVMTLAHELGHGIHDLCAAQNHYLDYHPVLPLAETASTFAEMLVFEKVQETLENPEEHLALICEKLEDTFATVFRQISMFRFERRLHETRRQEGELTTERINVMWQEAMQEMFGPSLTLGEDHQWTWLYIPHIVNTPFYVYAYAFGELLVLALYARYRQEGESFLPKYFELLSAGGSQAPARLLQTLGFDIASPAFWQGGCDLIRANLEKAKLLASRQVS